MRLALALLFAFTAAAAAPRPAIENLSAIAAQGKVSVRFTLDGAFREREMTQALQSGLPTSFTYNIEIYRDRPHWFNEEIARSRVEVICTFNSVTREYLLNYRRDRRLVRSETFTDLATLIHAMTAIDEPSLFEIGARKPYKLKVRVKADLMRGWLMYVIPWEISTHWRDVRVGENQKSEIRKQKSEIRNQKPETRNQKSARLLVSDFWFLVSALPPPSDFCFLISDFPPPDFLPGAP